MPPRVPPIQERARPGQIGSGCFPGFELVGLAEAQWPQPIWGADGREAAAKPPSSIEDADGSADQLEEGEEIQRSGTAPAVWRDYRAMIGGLSGGSDTPARASPARSA